MKPRPDLLYQHSPTGIEVFQLTDEPTVPSAHIYMEVQTFTPDSPRFILHRSANAHCDYQYRFERGRLLRCLPGSASTVWKVGDSPAPATRDRGNCSRIIIDHQ